MTSFFFFSFSELFLILHGGLFYFTYFYFTLLYFFILFIVVGLGGLQQFYCLTWSSQVKGNRFPSTEIITGKKKRGGGEKKALKGHPVQPCSEAGNG